MKAALIQQINTPDTDANLTYSLEQIANVSKQGAELIVLQELHQYLYFCQTESQQNFGLAEPLDGPTSKALAAAAKQHHIVIVGSIFEKRSNGIFHNTAVVFDRDGSMAGFYRKMHIPDDPGYYEKYYFTPGDTGFTPIATSLAKLGVLICWDQWFPESARLMALAGAELLIFLTAIGWDPNDSQQEQSRQLDAWQTIQRSHAIANNIPVIAVNRSGHEPDDSGQTAGINFWGNSFACDAMGKIITCCASNVSHSEVVEIDVQETERQRLIWPYFRDRRIDAYGEILKRSID